jgi:hypothetical protein
MNNNEFGRRWCVLIVLSALVTLAVVKPVQATPPGVTGHVIGLDAKGVPMGSVSGAKIEFKDRAGKVAASVISDKRGNYQATLQPGTYTYKVQAAGFKDENAARAITLNLSDGNAVYNFSLSRGKTDPKSLAPKLAAEAVGTLKGKVQGKTAEGKLIDIPEATISLRRPRDKKPTTVITRSNDPKFPKEQGHYQVILDAGAYQISVAAAGFETLVIADPQAITEGKTETRDFVLTLSKYPEPTGQGIKGSIKFADAKSLPAKVKVSIRSLSEGSTPSTPFDSDVKGAYQRDLRSGRYQVVAEAEGFRTAISEPKDVFAGKYTIVDLRLVPAVNKGLLFVATVYERPEGGGKTPLPGATVLLRKVGDSLTGAPKGMTGADGKVSLKAGSTGKHQVLATMKGYKSVGIPFDIASGDNHAEFELVRDGTAITYRLRIVEGNDKLKLARPVTEAKIALSQQGRAIQSGSSDSKGGHIFYLAPGTYQIDVTHVGYTPERREVTLAAGDLPRDVVVVLTKASDAKTAKLHLRVVERVKSGDKTSDRPIVGAEIVVNEIGKRNSFPLPKSGIGGGSSAALPAGSYEVSVTKTGFKPSTMMVDIAAKDVSREIIVVASEIPPNKLATLHLHVVERTKSGEKAVSSANIAITQKNKRIEGKHLTDKEGRLDVPLPAGSYSVAVTKAGYSSKTVELATQDGIQPIVLVASEMPPTKLATLNLRVVERPKSGEKTIAGAEIAISYEGRRIMPDSKSGPDGKWAAPLHAGNYTVVVTKAGFSSNTVRVEIAAQDVNYPDIVLVAIVPQDKKPIDKKKPK